MAESNTQRQRDFAANQARLGLVRVRLWVHKDATEKVKQFAAACNELQTKTIVVNGTPRKKASK